MVLSVIGNVLLSTLLADEARNNITSQIHDQIGSAGSACGSLSSSNEYTNCIYNDVSLFFYACVHSSCMYNDVKSLFNDCMHSCTYLMPACSHAVPCYIIALIFNVICSTCWFINAFSTFTATTHVILLYICMQQVFSKLFPTQFLLHWYSSPWHT
jgi:hypothetical protein